MQRWKVCGGELNVEVRWNRISEGGEKCQTRWCRSSLRLGWSYLHAFTQQTTATQSKMADFIHLQFDTIGYRGKIIKK